MLSFRCFWVIFNYYLFLLFTCSRKELFFKTLDLDVTFTKKSVPTQNSRQKVNLITIMSATYFITLFCKDFPTKRLTFLSLCDGFEVPTWVPIELKYPVKYKKSTYKMYKKKLKVTLDLLWTSYGTTLALFVKVLGLTTTDTCNNLQEDLAGENPLTAIFPRSP